MKTLQGTVVLPINQADQWVKDPILVLEIPKSCLATIEEMNENLRPELKVDNTQIDSDVEKLVEMLSKHIRVAIPGEIPEYC